MLLESFFHLFFAILTLVDSFSFGAIFSGGTFRRRPKAKEKTQNNQPTAAVNLKISENSRPVSNLKPKVMVARIPSTVHLTFSKNNQHSNNSSPNNSLDSNSSLDQVNFPNQSPDQNPIANFSPKPTTAIPTTIPILNTNKIKRGSKRGSIKKPNKNNDKKNSRIKLNLETNLPNDSTENLTSISNNANQNLGNNSGLNSDSSSSVNSSPNSNSIPNSTPNTSPSSSLQSNKTSIHEIDQIKTNEVIYQPTQNISPTQSFVNFSKKILPINEMTTNSLSDAKESGPQMFVEPILIKPDEPNTTMANLEEIPQKRLTVKFKDQTNQSKPESKVLNKTIEQDTRPGLTKRHSSLRKTPKNSISAKNNNIRPLKPTSNEKGNELRQKQNEGLPQPSLSLKQTVKASLNKHLGLNLNTNNSKSDKTKRTLLIKKRPTTLGVPDKKSLFFKKF